MRYTELLNEVTKIIEAHNNELKTIDRSNPMQCIVQLNKLLQSTLWLHTQTLKALEADASSALNALNEYKEIRIYPTRGFHDAAGNKLTADQLLRVATLAEQEAAVLDTLEKVMHVHSVDSD